MRFRFELKLSDYETNDCYMSFIISTKFYKNVVENKAEFILFYLQDEFSFFYIYCFSTINDKFCWQAYIARYP